MTAEEKKLLIKRIGIFILLCFIPNYALEIGFSDHKGGLTSAAASQTLMLYPAIANILTRIITKEGKNEHYLKANLKKHKAIYAGALIGPLIVGIINLLVTHCLFDSSADMGALLREKLDGNGIDMLIPVVISAYFSAAVFIVMGFGEEFGWRAYLTPKLEKLMPRFAACAVTGVVWGLWHAPMIWYGYDFGRDYPGFPYVGVLAMCAACIPLSYVLTWMTEKTKSVYPAAICHMVIDNVMNLPLAAMTTQTSYDEHSLMYGIIVLGGAPLVISIILIIKQSITKKAPSA